MKYIDLPQFARPGLNLFVENTSTPPKAMLIARKCKPPVRLPVESLIQPTIKGLTKPERLPIELIIAMPAAAAGPARYAVGRLQDNAIDDSTPIAAMVMPSSAITILLE